MSGDAHRYHDCCECAECGIEHRRRARKWLDDHADEIAARRRVIEREQDQMRREQEAAYWRIAIGFMPSEVARAAYDQSDVGAEST